MPIRVIKDRISSWLLRLKEGTLGSGASYEEAAAMGSNPNIALWLSRFLSEVALSPTEEPLQRFFKHFQLLHFKLL